MLPADAEVRLGTCGAVSAKYDLLPARSEVLPADIEVDLANAGVLPASAEVSPVICEVSAGRGGVDAGRAGVTRTTASIKSTKRKPPGSRRLLTYLPLRRGFFRRSMNGTASTARRRSRA